MGMFDYIRYNGYEYQTKNTPAQLLDYYDIHEDGTLWHNNYDCEWVEDENSFFKGYLRQFNERKEFCANFIGEIKFYRHLDKKYKKWEEFSAYFVNGKLRELHQISGENNDDNSNIIKSN
jgi:hypothetical protein